jgi:hypothetical protein
MVRYFNIRITEAFRNTERGGMLGDKTLTLAANESASQKSDWKLSHVRSISDLVQ